MRAPALLSAVVATLSFLTAVPAATAGEERPRWDTDVFSLVPTPGFPAMVYAHPNGRVYAGTYTNPRGDQAPSRVFEWSADGALLRSWTVPGQNLSVDHGVQVTISDAKGRLVLLEKSRPKALLLDPATGQFSDYASFPDLKPCSPGETGPECSPTLGDKPAIPNYGAWGPDGSLYVTDYGQAVIWRVPPGGGPAKVWLSDRRLDGEEFGTTGLALAADRKTLLFAQQSSAGLGELNPATGKLYAVAIETGGPGEIRRLWESRPGDLPDGFAIGRSGRIYIANIGASQQLAVLEPDGREAERFPEMPITGDNGSPVPFDSPSSAAFLGTRLLVANQSFLTGNPDHHAVLDVESGEDGLPVFIPATAGS